MILTIQECTPEERKYAGQQLEQISGQTGQISRIIETINIEERKEELLRSYLADDSYYKEVMAVLKQMRWDTDIAQLDKKATYHDPVTKTCYYRIDGEKMTFMIELYTTALIDDPIFQMWTYRKDWLDDHIKNARAGIKIVDTDYNTLLTLNDGDNIEMISNDEQAPAEKLECRYIDTYHFYVGKRLYHAAEFAELMEKTPFIVKKCEEPQKAAQEIMVIGGFSFKKLF